MCKTNSHTALRWFLCGNMGRNMQCPSSSNRSWMRLQCNFSLLKSPRCKTNILNSHLLSAEYLYGVPGTAATCVHLPHIVYQRISEFCADVRGLWAPTGLNVVHVGFEKSLYYPHGLESIQPASSDHLKLRKSIRQCYRWSCTQKN